jgi:hypothetical protein
MPRAQSRQRVGDRTRCPEDGDERAITHKASHLATFVVSALGILVSAMPVDGVARNRRWRLCACGDSSCGSSHSLENKLLPQRPAVLAGSPSTVLYLGSKWKFRMVDERPESGRHTHLSEFGKDVRIPPPLPYFIRHCSQSFAGGQSPFVRPLRSERIVNIHDLQHSRH